MKAVPASAQAKGSMYHGEMLMRYSQTAMDTMDINTALHAFNGLISNTCYKDVMVSCPETLSPEFLYYALANSSPLAAAT